MKKKLSFEESFNQQFYNHQIGVYEDVLEPNAHIRFWLLCKGTSGFIRYPRDIIEPVTNRYGLSS